MYTYDPIGNRITAGDSSGITDCTANALNQYTEIAAVAQTDIPEYDDDGNLLKISADGPVMSYDGENRLSTVEYEGLLGDVNGDKSVNLADAVTSLQVAAGMTPPGVTAAGDVSADGKIGIEEAVFALQVSAGLRAAATAARKTVFAYDYMGRRVKKAVYVNGLLLSETLFVYEGWNVIEEITRVNGSDSSRYFVWGLDLSQSLQGAGGIGGLLCMSDATASYHYFYDANGNVSQLVNAVTGTIAAHYEYDPFGNLTAKSGTYADANPFRFSTKYFDAETELYDFGLRDYLPGLGRWTSRDPIGEHGGMNLYSYVFNNPVNRFDPYGLMMLFGGPGSSNVRPDRPDDPYEYEGTMYDPKDPYGMPKAHRGLEEPFIGEDAIVDIIEIGAGTFIFHQIGKGIIKKGTKEIGEECLEKIETKMLAPKKQLRQYIPDGLMKGKRIGHTFSLHGSHNTHQLIMRAKGSGLPQGQWLDDAVAEKFIAERLDQLKNGAKTFKLPDGLGRIIYPDGTFKPATEVRLVPSKSGVKTAYPEG